MDYMCQGLPASAHLHTREMEALSDMGAMMVVMCLYEAEELGVQDRSYYQTGDNTGGKWNHRDHHGDGIGHLQRLIRGSEENTTVSLCNEGSWAVISIPQVNPSISTSSSGKYCLCTEPEGTK